MNKCNTCSSYFGQNGCKHLNSCNNCINKVLCLQCNFNRCVHCKEIISDTGCIHFDLCTKCSKLSNCNYCYPKKVIIGNKNRCMGCYSYVNKCPHYCFECSAEIDDKCLKCNT